jgi:carbamoyltransferase
LIEIFDQVFIPPATNDSGLALGAGAYVEWLKGNKIKRHLPYLNNWQLDTQPVIDDSTDLQRIAQMLLEHKVLGVCNGYGEAGPRALGNRSIIALPDDKSLAKIISQQKKGREWYRPIAPIMLESVARQVTGKSKLPEISKYMLVSFKILPQFYGKLKGVIHTDGTSRIQVLFSRQDNPFMWDLLQYLYERYKVLGLINTSFNAKGKPIVHFERQATDQARQMHLDGLIVNGRLYENY